MISETSLLREALELGRQAMRTGGGPFGALVSLGGKVVARGMNESVPRNDPTAHAEMMALRAAGAALGRRNLSDCVLYSSCAPCPMCLAACYWAQIPRIICAATSSDATAAGFPDKAILDELCRTASSRLIQITQLLPADGRRLFEEWTAFQAGARDAIGGTTD